MKIQVFVALTLLTFTINGSGETITQTNIARAQAIIDSSVEAYGGIEKIDALNSLIISHKTLNIAVGQSLTPEPPWDRNSATGTDAIDLTNETFITRNQGSGGGFEFDTETIISGESSRRIDNRAGTRAAIENPDFANTSGPFTRVTPILLVRQAHARAQNAYYLGDVEIADDTFEVVGFSMTVGPAISLYFNKSSHLLERAERVLAGFGLVEYEFANYHNLDGIPFNQSFRLFLNGEENMIRTNVKTEVNTSLDSLLIERTGLSPAPAVVTNDLSRQEMSDGVYLIGGTGTYAMFVEMTDHVVAIGGTSGIADRITLLREVIPNKPIKYGVLTHHHSDHVLGVSAYEEIGATVLAANAHEQAVRAASADGDSLNFHGVTDNYTMKDDHQIIELIDIGPTAHSEHILVAWLPNEKILFQADHFNIPAEGSVPPAVSATQGFAAALKNHKIKPKMILSAHSKHPASLKDLKLALKKAKRL